MNHRKVKLFKFITCNRDNTERYIAALNKVDAVYVYGNTIDEEDKKLDFEVEFINYVILSDNI